MKKATLTLISLTVLITAFVSSCSLLSSSSESSASSVTVLLPARASREKYTQDDVSYYSLQLLTQEEDIYAELPEHDDGPAVFDQVIEGTYMVKMQAFSSEDKEIASGKSDLFHVNAGEESLVDLTLVLYNYFILTLNANVPGMAAETTLKTGTRPRAPDCSFTNLDPTNNIFNGWATTPTATEGEYYPGDYMTLSGNTTLYAVWSDHMTVKSFSVLKYAVERGIKKIHLGSTIYITEDFTIEGTSGDEYMIDGRGEHNIFSYKDSVLTFSYVSFENGCGNAGGMISKSAGSLIIKNCIFNDCKTRVDAFGELGTGGVICVTNASLTIEDSAFSNSAYTDAQASHGGILYVGPGCPSVTIKNSEFLDGYAVNGGAMMLFSSANIDNCEIHDNISGEVDPLNNNAAIEISDIHQEGIVVNITNCTIYNNIHADFDNTDIDLSGTDFHVMANGYPVVPTVNLTGSKDSSNNPIILTNYNL